MPKTSKSIPTLLALCLMLVSGCGGYGQVSDTTYQYAKALYSVANRQMEDKLEPVSNQIELARDRGELPNHEAEWLQDIIDDARQGEWETASRAARRIMTDQAGLRPPGSNSDTSAPGEALEAGSGQPVVAIFKR